MRAQFMGVNNTRGGITKTAYSLAENGHGDGTWPRPSAAYLLAHSSISSACFGAMVASPSRFQPNKRAENGNVLLPPIFKTGWSIKHIGKFIPRPETA